jgi:small subunit ribosomal protein S5
MRAVFEVMGVTDIVAKSHRFDQPLQHGACHAGRAEALDTPAEVAAKRGKTVEDIFN